MMGFRPALASGTCLVLPLAVIAAAALSGCTTSRTCPAAPARPPATSGPVIDIRTTCAMELKRQLKCMDTFVPMIVDTRIRLDLPRGIAARGKDETGRAELIAIAKKEFVVDKAPERHKRICDGRQAVVEAMPPERLKALTAMGLDECLAEPDCQGFTKCQARVLEKMLVAARPHGERRGE